MSGFVVAVFPVLIQKLIDFGSGLLVLVGFANGGYCGRLGAFIAHCRKASGFFSWKYEETVFRKIV